MSRFDDCLNFVLDREGGYSNRKEDRGGATNYGITQLTYDLYRKSKGMAVDAVRFISLADVKEIYKTEYWATSKANAMPEPLDLVLFDIAVNSGPVRAARILQTALGITADGIIGSQTLDAVAEEAKAGNLKHIAQLMIDIRRDFYRCIVESDDSQAANFDGWMNRCTLLSECIA